MTPYQEKYSKKRNYESRIQKYKEKVVSLNGLKKQEISKERKIEISKEIVYTLKALKQETKEYRKLKSELRHKFPGEGKKGIVPFSTEGGKGVSADDILRVRDESEDEDEDAGEKLKIEEVQAQEKKRALNKELSKFHRELFKVYAISEEQRREFVKKQERAFSSRIPASEKGVSLKETVPLGVGSGYEKSLYELKKDEGIMVKKGNNEENDFQGFEKIIIER